MSNLVLILESDSASARCCYHHLQVLKIGMLLLRNPAFADGCSMYIYGTPSTQCSCNHLQIPETSVLPTRTSICAGEYFLYLCDTSSTQCPYHQLPILRTQVSLMGHLIWSEGYSLHLHSSPNTRCSYHRLDIEIGHASDETLDLQAKEVLCTSKLPTTPDAHTIAYRY